MTPTLETPRLWLRPLAIADADQIQELFPKWEIVRLMSHLIPWPYPAEAALAWIRDVAIPQVERGEAWHWTLRLKTDAEQIIGAIGLATLDNNNRGFWLAPDWQGRGLMTEAADAVTDYWFDVLGFPVLRAPKAVDNVASRRISEKQGMRVVGQEERGYVSGRLPSEIWEITADEWRAGRRLGRT